MLGDLLKPGVDGDVVIVGFPFDEGTLRNKGRGGSSEGPDAVRRHFARVGPATSTRTGKSINLSITDAGNISATSLEEAHSKLRELVAGVLKRGGVPIVIGGSNDQSAPNGLAFLDTAADPSKCAIINVDAHLDARPLLGEKQDIPHSGSPFRILLNDGRLRGENFYEYATQEEQNHPDHIEFVRSKGGKITWYDECSIGAFTSIMDAAGQFGNGKVFLSFDIDSIHGAECPGVSCPAVYGLRSEDALKMCRIAGQKNCALLDISELNPKMDDYRSPRLVAMMCYHFIAGLAECRAAAK